MRRAPHALRTAAWAVLLAVTLLWWSPSIALGVVGFLLDRLRFALTMALVDVLRGLGRQDAALRGCEAARRRCERQMRALAERRG